MSHKFKGLLRHITALVICRRRRRRSRRRLGSGLQLKLELGLGWAVPKSSVYFCICFTVSQFQSQFRFQFQFHCMILHKTTVSLSSPPLCNPHSLHPYSICPLPFALANLNFWQFLLQSWHHSCSLCSPKKKNQEKQKMVYPKIETDNKNKYTENWSLCFTFAFCCCFFFGAYFCRSFRYFRLFLLLCGWQHQLWLTVRWKPKSFWDQGDHMVAHRGLF